MNRFVIHAREYGVSHDGGIGFRDDPRHVRLADLGLRVRERFLYEYDFTDGWQHDVRLEHILPLAPRRGYPVCVGGRRAVPPEDCDGLWAFLDLPALLGFPYRSGCWSCSSPAPPIAMVKTKMKMNSCLTTKNSCTCCAG